MRRHGGQMDRSTAMHHFKFRACVKALLLAGPWLALAFQSPAVRSATPPAPAAKATPACSGLLQQNFLRLQDEKPQSLCQYSGKVVVVVNTASFCAFTPQYE